MAKIYDDHSSLNAKILSGVTKLANNVKTTMGPRGRNVVLHQKGRNPIITKDGVTVSEFIDFEDPFENIGAQVVKQAARQTNSLAGDGTTTSTVLAYSIVKNAQKYLAAGVSPVDLKRGIDKAVEHVVEELKELARPIESEDEVKMVATISANGDESIGKLISRAVDAVGKDGSVIVQEAKSMNTTLDLIEGFRFDSGYISSQFITNERKGTMEYNEPYFLVTDQRIDNVEQLMPALELVARENKPLIVVAEEVEGQALAALIANTLRGSLAVAAIKAPRYGDERRNILSDLAVSVGAKFFTRLAAEDIRTAKLIDFGKAKSIECTKTHTIIMGGKGLQEEIDKRVESLKVELTQTQDLRECERIQERISRLSSGIAVINIGAATEVEMIEKKHRVEDALEAVKSALDEGIVSGGGSALFFAADYAGEALEKDTVEENYVFGFKLLLEACCEPLRTIVQNAGGKPDVVREMVVDSHKDQCYDAVNEKMVDATKAGIIDPVKVTRTALQNAASAAGTLITTDHAVVEV
jgi:chaperonin GroEL